MTKPPNKLGPRAQRIAAHAAKHAIAHEIVSNWREQVSQQGRQNVRAAIAGFRRQTGR